MQIQVFIMIGTITVFAALAFMMSRSIKKFEQKKALEKKKKGRLKYMPQSRIPGNK